MSRRLVVCALVAVVVMATACASRPRMDPRIILEPGLGSLINIHGVDLRVGPGGFQEVQVRASSRVQYTVKIKYKVEWFDTQGHLIDSITSRWELMDVLSAQPFEMRSVATRTDASNFRIQIRKQ